jgi:SAM-dependent methyltransferase
MPLIAGLRTYAQGLYVDSERMNEENMRRQLASASRLRDVVDLGCGDGRVTKALTDGLGITALRAVEGYGPYRAAATARGIDAIDADLEQRLPFADDTFDAVVSNQVIEHLADTDTFVAEIRRVLRSGGVAVIATENMASWHNIGALLLGFQPFSSSNYSRERYPLGNPVGLHADEGMTLPDGMLHRRIFTGRALRELVAAHGLEVVDLRGAGYHPFPPGLGRIDVMHSHFISIAARKR